MKLGDVIREYREHHGMSQRTFARKCGLSNVQIAFLERGYGSNGKPFEPTFDTLRKVARAMGTTAESLMYEKYIVNYINEADFAIMRGGKNKMAIDCISAYLTTKVLAERMVMELEAPKDTVE